MASLPPADPYAHFSWVYQDLVRPTWNCSIASYSYSYDYFTGQRLPMLGLASQFGTCCCGLASLGPQLCQLCAHNGAVMLQGSMATTCTSRTAPSTCAASWPATSEHRVQAACMAPTSSPAGHLMQMSAPHAGTATIQCHAPTRTTTSARCPTPPSSVGPRRHQCRHQCHLPRSVSNLRTFGCGWLCNLSSTPANRALDGVLPGCRCRPARRQRHRLVPSEWPVLLLHVSDLEEIHPGLGQVRLSQRRLPGQLQLR